jgi:hypothetical protein
MTVIFTTHEPDIPRGASSPCAYGLITSAEPAAAPVTAAASQLEPAGV